MIVHVLNKAKGQIMNVQACGNNQDDPPTKTHRDKTKLLNNRRCTPRKFQIRHSGQEKADENATESTNKANH